MTFKHLLFGMPGRTIRCLVSFVACSSGGLWFSTSLDAATAPPTPLLIDFQNMGGGMPAGYQPYEAVNQNLSTLGPRSYISPVPATIEVKVENLPDGASDFRVVSRAGGASVDVRDWIGIDARLGPPGSSTAGNPRPSMSIVVSDLPDGLYAWSSRHHDPLNQTGIVTYVFSDADGPSGGTIDISSSTEPITTFDTDFRSSAGAPVTLRLTVTEPSGTSRFAVEASFALINSLQITPIPEPHSTLLLAAGAATIGSLQRRRRGA